MTMKQIRLEVPMLVGRVIRIMSVTAVVDGAQRGANIAYLWGDIAGAGEQVPENTFKAFGQGTVFFPAGPDVDAMVSGSASMDEVAAAVLGMLAGGTQTAPALKGAVEDAPIVVQPAQ
jgi:hypothetical protein